MRGYLVVVARDALAGASGRHLVDGLRACVAGSSTGVLVLVDSLGTTPAPAPAGDHAGVAARPGLLVVGTPPPYDGRPLRALALRAPGEPEEKSLLTAWLDDDQTDLYDLPLALSGLLLCVTTVAPRMLDLGGTARREGRERDSA